MSRHPVGALAVDGQPAITVALTFELDDLAADGLREFARDWRRQAIHADRLSIPQPPDFPAYSHDARRGATARSLGECRTHATY